MNATRWRMLCLAERQSLRNHRTMEFRLEDSDHPNADYDALTNIVKTPTNYSISIFGGRSKVLPARIPDDFYLVVELTDMIEYSWSPFESYGYFVGKSISVAPPGSTFRL